LKPTLAQNNFHLIYKIFPLRNLCGTLNMEHLDCIGDLLQSFP